MPRRMLEPGVMPSSPPEDPGRLPRKLGDYLLFEPIGKGGMAEIFLAVTRTELGGRRLCVVKRILPTLAAQQQFAEMLIFEAKLAARLDHANVVRVTDLGRADGELFIAMEYVEGFDLNDLLKRCTRERVALPREFALGIVCAVLRGLDYAHRRTSEAGLPLGIVHRDVSPSNVLLSFEGEVKLCDFGIAHANQLASGEAAARVHEEALQGKAGYMSPEHARGESLDARADVFAAGILLWELLSGKRMYKKDGAASLLDQARAAEIPPLSARGVQGEERLHAIVRRALAPNREDRYPSAAAFLRDLEEHMSAEGLTLSSIKLGTWLESTFGADVVVRRRMKARAAEALEKGPPVVIKPIIETGRQENRLEAPRREDASPSSRALGPSGGKRAVFIGIALAVVLAAFYLLSRGS